MKTRALDKKTLDQAVRDYAGRFLLPTKWSKKNPEKAIDGQLWVMQSMQQFHFKDEFDHVLAGVKGYMGQEAYKEFQKLAKDYFTPRSNDVFEEELATRLAIRPDGSVIDGAVGTVKIGQMITGWEPVVVKSPDKVRPDGSIREGRVYTTHRPIKKDVLACGPGYDWLDAQRQSVGALAFNMAASAAILMLDALVDDLDSGTGAAVIQGRSGAQPADPDAATTGTLLFTCVMTDPAFGGAADNADGTVTATAASISDDTSADATATVGYCRVSSTNDGATPLDDKIDGSAGTASADFIFNTTAIVSGANVAISSYTITLDQGSSAT